MNKDEIEDWYSSLWEDCRNYGLIDLIESVERIGNQCFSSCVKMKEIIIPESVTQIGISCFRNCYRIGIISKE